MKIGITGTRSGCTNYQKDALSDLLSSFKLECNEIEFHHGDCIGVDVEIAAIAKKLGYRIVCHPPIKNDLRGFFESDEVREPFSYFARNRNIVDECDLLLVVPYQSEWQAQGGTWYTNDYAQKQNKLKEIIWPEPKE